MSDRLVSMYFDIRERVVGAAVILDDGALATRVPACPDWTVHQLVAHLVSMPMAIIAGDIPEAVMGGGDPNPWLRGLVDEHAERSITDLARWWASDDDALTDLLPGAGLLLADLFTHESDLHGAVGSRGHRDAAGARFADRRGACGRSEGCRRGGTATDLCRHGDRTALLGRGRARLDAALRILGGPSGAQQPPNPRRAAGARPRRRPVAILRGPGQPPAPAVS